MWEDDPAPEHARDCRACYLCEGPQRVSWGEGNHGAKLLIVLDNPGRRWLQDGTPYFCGTRKVLQRLLTEALIPLSDCYVTSLIKCRPRPKKPQSREAVDACFPFFEEQFPSLKHLEAGVACGGLVMRALFGPAVPEENLHGFRGHWQMWRGLPFMPTYHPYVAFRSPHLLKFIAQDLADVRVYLSSAR